MTLPPFENGTPEKPPTETSAVTPQPRPSRPERPRRSRGPLLFLLGTFVLLAATLVFFLAISLLVDDGEVGILADSVVVMPVLGEIVDSRSFIEDLHRYQENGNVKAIVVRLETPGGGITPSQEIYDELVDFRRESGKPVIASMGSVAASGGYYIAAACDHIVAAKGTVTGSIGVIAQWMNLEGLLEWARVEPTTFTSGDQKDLGNPYREMTEEERLLYQAFIDELHGQFVDAVAAGREIDREEVVEIADGRIFTGARAVELGLVDEIGNVWDAISIAGERAGIGSDPRVVYPRYEDPGLIDLLFSSEKLSVTESVRYLMRANRSPFQYRWR